MERWFIKLVDITCIRNTFSLLRVEADGLTSPDTYFVSCIVITPGVIINIVRVVIIIVVSCASDHQYASHQLLN